MDASIIFAGAAIAGVTAGGVIGYLFGPKSDEKSAPWVERYEHIDVPLDGVPMIEIDGVIQPHPTHVARRKGKSA